MSLWFAPVRRRRPRPGSKRRREPRSWTFESCHNFTNFQESGGARNLRAAFRVTPGAIRSKSNGKKINERKFESVDGNLQGLSAGAEIDESRETQKHKD